MDKDWENERDVYLAMAMERGLPFVDLLMQQPDPAAILLISPEIAQMHNALPMKLDNYSNVLWVAMSRTDNPHAADDLRSSSGYKVRCVLAAPKALASAISKAYGS